MSKSRQVRQGKLSPEATQELIQQWLRGWTFAQLAREFGLTRQAVAKIVHTHAIPEFKLRIGDLIEEEVAKIGNIERLAWERFFDGSAIVEEREEKETVEGPDGEQTTRSKLVKVRHPMSKSMLGFVQWAITQRCKLLGLRSDSSDPAELRLAGLSREEIEQAMQDRLAKAVKAKLEE